MAVSKTSSAGEGIIIALTLVVSAAVGVIIYVYGSSVRDVCLGGGFSEASSNLFAVLACAPILAALYSIDT